MKLRFFPLVVVALLFATAVTAQVNDTYVIPAAANAPGLNGTRWATEFHLFNPQSKPLRVTLTLLPTGGTPGSTVRFNVAANGTAFSPNILADVFGYTGTGALTVATFAADNPAIENTVIARSFMVTSNTFNNAVSGTFGQSIPGTFFPFMDDGIYGVSSGIQNWGSNTTGFRTNIGAVNLGRTSVTMYVNVYDSDGSVIRKDIPFFLPPQGHMQDSFNRLGIQVEDGTVEYYIDDPTNSGAVVFPYASVVDNLSGDPTYAAPVLLASPGALLETPGAAQLKTINNSHVRDAVAASRDLGEVVVVQGKIFRAATQ